MSYTCGMRKIFNPYGTIIGAEIFTLVLSYLIYYLCEIPVNMPVGARTGPVLVQCWQHRPSTGPVQARNSMFTGFSHSLYCTCCVPLYYISTLVVYVPGFEYGYLIRILTYVTFTLNAFEVDLQIIHIEATSIMSDCLWRFDTTDKHFPSGVMIYVLPQGRAVHWEHTHLCS